MRYASVCDGIGAAHVAWQPLGWECAWTSEIEPFPAAVVDHHWKFKNLGDMTLLTEKMLDEPVDLLVGGTPCQSFSVAGLRGGLADPRGNLALRFVQLVGFLRPRWVVWENVPGVLSSAGGRDFGTFLGALGQLGYGFAYRILDAQWFGVAQRRRRVFVVAHAGDWRRAAAVLFERESVFGNPPTRGATGEIAPTIPARRTAGGGLGTDFDCDGGLIQQAYGFADGSGGGLAKPLGSHALSKGRGTDLDNTTYVAFAQNQREEVRDLGDCSTALNLQGSHQQTFLATPYTKSKRAQSTTDDETWVPGEVSPTMSCFDQGDTRATTVVAYDIHGTRATKGASTTDCHTALRSRPPGQSEASTTTVVAFKESQSGCRVGDLHATLDANKGSRRVEGVICGDGQTVGTLRSNTRNNSSPTTEAAMHVMHGMAVRRLTPKECERLQGFPDGYTDVTYRGKPAADGPRYRALGNSMAVPVMAWIGQRVQMVMEATDGTQGR
jgi:DNA (cytosine-5)-methyltransferase 1